MSGEREATEHVFAALPREAEYCVPDVHSEQLSKRQKLQIDHQAYIN